MIDPKLLREQPDAVARNLARRDAAFDTAAYAELEARRKKWQVRVEQLRADRNKLSRKIGVAAREGGDVDALKRQVEKATYGLDGRRRRAQVRPGQPAQDRAGPAQPAR